MAKESLQIGDYVLATKYPDGDPQDHWCVGFYDDYYDSGTDIRHMVVDDKGEQFRGNGFRRVEQITIELGDYLLRNKDIFESMGKSIWSLL